MQIAPVKRIYLPSMHSKVVIWNFADIHLGVANCDEKLLARVIKAIATRPNNYWIGLGDFIDAISPQDQRRFDPRTLADWITKDDLVQVCYKQTEKVIEYLQPIAKKCLGICSGNHEESAMKYYGIPVGQMISGALKAPYLDYYGVVPLVFGRGKEGRKDGLHQFKIVATHGNSGSITTGSVTNVLERAINRHSGIDAIFMGHLHRRIAITHERIGVNKALTGTKAFNCVGIMSGAFFRSYKDGVPSYSEKKGHPPASLGPMAIEVGFTRDSNSRSTHLYVRPLQPEY